MNKQTNLGGSLTLANTSLTVNRMGYDAMQLAGRKCGAGLATSMAQSEFCAKRLKLV
jgi:hypothetical protein